MSASSILTTVLPILQALINDIPKAISVIDLVLPAIKEGRNLTDAEWTTLNGLADSAHTDLQNAVTGSSTTTS